MNIDKNRQAENLLFLFTDDQRFDTIHALGNSDISTPNYDRLVETGTSFINAYIMGSSHEAVCMPSRAMMHTGRGLFDIDKDAQIPPEHITIGQHFQKNGFVSFGTGKWHNGTESFARSFNCGGRVFFGGMADHWNVPVADFDPNGVYPEGDRYVVERHHSSTIFADDTISFLDSEQSKKPFFGYVAFMAPHDPRTMPKQFLELYAEKNLPIPENFLPEHPFDNGELLVRDELLAAFPRNRNEIQEHLREYYAMISHLDFEIGRILDALERNGKLDSTLIVLAGDNGLALGQHGLMGKQNLYEHSIKVPFIFSGPGIPTGKRVSNPTYIHSLFATVCELMGLSCPKSVLQSGLKLEIIEDVEDSEKRMSFAYKGVQRALRIGRLKIIKYKVDGKVRLQMFDLQEDPEERFDISAKEGMDNIFNKMLDCLDKELCSIGDENF